jgi:hypothetical protein
MNLLLAAALVLGIDTDGMVLVNGQRTFVIGAYALPKLSEPLRAAKLAGFNLVHGDPDQAAKNGLLAWVTTGTDPEKVKKTVAAMKDKPALAFWEIEDEPTFVWKKPLEIRTTPEKMIATRRWIESVDKRHLFYLNHSPTNLVSTLRRYNDSTDAVATDIYPVIPRGIRNQYALWPDGQQGDLLNETVSQAGTYTAKMRRVAGPAKPVFLVLQGFAWESIQKSIDPAMLVYPSLAQSRFMAYQAIVHGANGVIYWGLHLGPAGNPAWQAVRATVEELRDLAPELSARPLHAGVTLEYFDTGHSLDRGIEFIVKPSAEGVLLIATNADKNPVDVEFRGLRGCRSLSGAAPARPVLRETFSPFEARVYRCAGIR